MITPTGGFACRRTNKIQFLITKMTLINQFIIWSFVFDNYLKFVICYLKHCAFARDIYAIIAKNFVISAAADRWGD